MKKESRFRKQWRLWRLGAVERYYFELKENDTYPFEDLGDGFYYYSMRSDKFMFGIATIVLAILCYMAFSLIIGSFSFPLILFLTVLGYGVFCLYGNTSSKELIISRYGGYILRIQGNEKIVVEEPINNVYIKLQRKYDTNILPHYYLILGGYRLDDIRLTGICMQDGPLRILGGGVAARMGVNFFDVDNNSTLHKIYHYPTRSLLTPPEDEFSRFLQVHDLTDKEIREATEKEGIDEVTNVVPKDIVSRVLVNYGLRQGPKDLQGRFIRQGLNRAEFVTRKPNKTLAVLLETDEQRHKLESEIEKRRSSLMMLKRLHKLNQERKKFSKDDDDDD